MPNHKNLLRLHRWQLDERQRYAAELESLSERLRAELGLLQAAIALEAGTSDSCLENEDGSRHPSRRLIERQRKLEHSLAEVESQIVQAREAIVAAEHEVAAYELASAHRRAISGTLPPHARHAHGIIASPVLVRRFGS